MAHTVIGFFKNSSDAYSAVDVLKSKGFENSNIDVSSNSRSFENADEHREHTSKVGNFFKSLFGDDDDNSRRYSEVAKENSIVTVHTYSENEAENAADILDDCGAIDVDDSGYTDTANADYSQRQTNTVSNNDYADTTTNLTGDTAYDVSDKMRSNRSNEERSIPIIQEQVNIGKREVRRGGVRVRSRIVEKPVEETLRLREERVRVERNPVDRVASDSDLETFREETIEVHEYGEEPVISKQARVVEEVSVGKDVDERKETIRDTERKTEVDVEEFAKTHDRD